MTADHYPYALVTDEVDYYQELSGKQDSELDISRYKNTWLLWSGLSLIHISEPTRPY